MSSDRVKKIEGVLTENLWIIFKSGKVETLLILLCETQSLVLELRVLRSVLALLKSVATFPLTSAEPEFHPLFL